MRILFAQAHPRDATLGSPKSILRLGPQLEKLGHQVDYFFLDDVPPALRSRRLLYLTFPALIAAHVRRRNYDVVDISSGDAVLLGAIRRTRRRGSPPIVSRVLGMEHIHWAELKESTRRGEEVLSWYHRAWFGGLRLKEVELSTRLADHVLCLCQQDKRHIINHGWRDAKSVTIVPPGVDDVYLQAEPSRLDKPHILFLGTWTSRKGIHDLVQAFDLVLEELPTARLVVAGAHTPPDRVLASFSPRARSAVDIVPTSNERNLVAWMQTCSVMAFPSLYEGFGIAFLEAMAVGLPVVATPTGGMADLLQPGINGELVPVRDPGALAKTLLGILNHQTYRCRLGEAARDNAQDHTWYRSTAQTCNAYFQHVFV